MIAAGLKVPSKPKKSTALKSLAPGVVTELRSYTATTSLPGVPAPLALISAARELVTLLISPAMILVAAELYAYGPAFAAAVNSYVAGPAAGALLVAVEPPVAPLFAPALVRWTTSSTMTTTPTTEESR
jgi:hypothetical protein